jgi:hypothetical protein
MAVNIMSFNNIILNNKQLFDSYFKQFEPDISDLTFTNLFMWRNYYRYVFKIISGHLCIIANPEDSEPYALMPVGSLMIDEYSKLLPGLRGILIKKAGH